MARSVLVIHGAGEPRRRRGKVYWEPLLRDSLGRKYRVLAPRMPRPEHPQYWTWARRIDELVGSTRGPILVGYSFGASVLLKWVLDDRGHEFNQARFPELAADIRDLALRRAFAVSQKN
jgi:serine hydrolase